MSAGMRPPKKMRRFSIYQKPPVQSRPRFGITPRRGGGKARRISHQSPTAAAAPNSEKATAKRRRCAWPATNLEPRPPPAAREKNQASKRLEQQRTRGAECRGDPAACATMRSRGAVPVAPGTAVPVPLFPRPKPPPTTRQTGYALREAKRKMAVQVWFGGWHDGEEGEGTEILTGARVDETREAREDGGGWRRYGEELGRRSRRGRRCFNGGRIINWRQLSRPRPAG